MMHYKKDRNYLIFWDDENEQRQWKLDFTTGTMYGISGKPVKNVPAKMGVRALRAANIAYRPNDCEPKQYFENFILHKIIYMYGSFKAFFDNYDSESIKIFERICNAQPEMAKCNWLGIVFYNAGEIEFINKHFKKLLALMQETHSLSFSPLIQVLKNEEAFKKYNKYFKSYNEEQRNFIMRHVDSTTINVPLFFNWLNSLNTIITIEMRPPYNLDLINGFNYGDYGSVFSNWVSWICSVFKMADNINYKLEKGNPLEQYKYLIRDYANLKHKEYNKVIVKYQNPYWTFQDDRFTAIVPTSLDEFITEGNQQHNCVGDYWLHHYGNNISKGLFARGAVFIRRNDQLDKSCVTCDFQLNSMKIEQYEIHNSTKEESDYLIDIFRPKLQEHLKQFV